VDELEHRGSGFRSRCKADAVAVSQVEIADAMAPPPQTIGRLTIFEAPVIAATD
jgi:hypothetical protein